MATGPRARLCATFYLEIRRKLVENVHVPVENGAHNSPMRNNTWTWVGLVGLAATAVLFCLLQAQPALLAPHFQLSSVLAGGSLLGLIGISVLVGWRANAGIALRQAMSWLAIALMIVVGYAYRHDFVGVVKYPETNQLAAQAIQTRPGVVSLGGTGNGHFFADAKVDGTHVRFLVDTGASHVALAPIDAQRLGHDIDELDYRIRYQTANGVAYAAPITLDEVSIGSITLRNVQASVSRDGLSQSLLGMSFLGELSTVELSGDRLILRE